MTGTSTPWSLYVHLHSLLGPYADRTGQLCALCSLRKLEIAHLDIKPNNILIAPDGRAVLTDFGMARGVPEKEYDRWKANSTPVGTYPYMAPEMVKRENFGTAADVWSMGLVLLEVLGVEDEPRFEAESLEGIFLEHAAVPLFDFKGIRRMVHPTFGALLEEVRSFRAAAVNQ